MLVGKSPRELSKLLQRRALESLSLCKPETVANTWQWRPILLGVSEDGSEIFLGLRSFWQYMRSCTTLVSRSLAHCLVRAAALKYPALCNVRRSFGGQRLAAVVSAA